MTGVFGTREERSEEGGVVADGRAASGRSVDSTPVDVLAWRGTQVGRAEVQRVLPQRRRRLLGAWCFVDYLAPLAVDEIRGLDVAPHPHVGLQTLTWLMCGEALHRDSLGTEQVLRPGALNLMTAGCGVAHSEEASPRYRGELRGLQLWIAQPEATRHAPPAFGHVEQVPIVELGSSRASVLIGTLAGVGSPLSAATPLVGADLRLAPGCLDLPLEPGYEHGLLVVDGAIAVGDRVVSAGEMALWAPGTDGVRLETREAARCLLLGGEPFGESVLMWWNYVARSRAEILEADLSWRARDGRFGAVASPLAPVVAPTPPFS